MFIRNVSGVVCVAGVLVCVIGLALSTAHAAPQPLSVPYAQAFDTLAAAGTNVSWSDDATLPGWYASRTAYNASNGGSNTGALYSFGTGSASERALGGIASGSTNTILFGVRLVNDSAATITSVAMQYA